MFVAVQDDDKIAVFTMDAGTGKLTRKTEVPVLGGPSLLAINPDRDVLYVGHRGVPEISSWRIDHGTGRLTKNGTVSPGDAPVFLSTDRKGRYLLSSYYMGGYAGVHPIGDDGSVGDPPVEGLATDIGAHSIQTDPSNKFAFVPHIARLNDNVLEPFRESYGPNAIFQLKFDETTGQLTPNAPMRVEPKERLGHRHYCFHPTKNIVYFSDEQGCSVTGYRLDISNGALSHFQTITTLPAGYTGRNTCSQIQISSSGKFLYAGNRGHNSIAGFSVDAASGRLKAIEQTSAEAVPGAFSLDPEGKFLFAAGTVSGRLGSYRINGDTGKLTPLETYSVGKRPAWVLVTRFGD
jgi:6-phosphogluconolactonase